MDLIMLWWVMSTLGTVTDYLLEKPESIPIEQMLPHLFNDPIIKIKCDAKKKKRKTKG